MRTRRLLVCVLLALMIVGILPTGAHAAFYNSQATSADAWWSSWDWNTGGEPPAGTALIDWNVSGYEGGGIFKDAGVPLDNMKVTAGWASMSSYTPAAGKTPQSWTEFSCMAEPPSLLTFGKSLGSANLEFVAPATLNVWKKSEPWVQTGPDEWIQREPDSTTTEMVSVVVSWKATGALTRSKWTSRERSADFMWADRMSDMYRAATAQATIVGESGTVYLQPGMYGSLDARISDSKSTGRFNGEMPF